MSIWRATKRIMVKLVSLAAGSHVVFYSTYSRWQGFRRWRLTQEEEMHALTLVDGQEGSNPLLPQGFLSRNYTYQPMKKMRTQ